jgi:hypothetical protein
MGTALQHTRLDFVQPSQADFRTHYEYLCFHCTQTYLLAVPSQYRFQQKSMHDFPDLCLDLLAFVIITCHITCLAARLGLM